MIVAAPGRLRDGVQALLASYLDAEPLVVGEGGPSAAEAIRAAPPDLVILDAGLLGAGTAALVHDIKSNWSWMGCIVVVDRIGHLQAMQEAGADHVLLRGFSMPRLFDAVDALRRQAGQRPGVMTQIIEPDTDEPAPFGPEDSDAGPAQDDLLSGTRWAVMAYAMGPGMATPLPDAAFTIEFTSDGRAHIYAACSHFTARYAVQGSTLSIGEPSGTTNLCDPSAMRHVNAFLTALTSASSFKVLGNNLYIASAIGLRMLECARIGQ